MEIILQILFSIALATLLSAVALWKNALTRRGLILAWALCVVIVFCGGLSCYLALASTFLFTVLAGKISGSIGREVGQALHRKTGRRDGVQVFCNVAIGSLMLALRSVTGLELFLWAFGGAMAASLGDSMASELGVLSPSAPRDICTMKPVEKGLSGGVTVLGLVCSALGAAVVAAICSFGRSRGVAMFSAITAAGFIAALADSLMGSLAQAKYCCPVCGAVTEKPVHCGAEGNVIKGFAFINNDVVNFLNNCIGALAAAIFYMVIIG